MDTVEMVSKLTWRLQNNRALILFVLLVLITLLWGYEEFFARTDFNPNFMDDTPQLNLAPARVESHGATDVEHGLRIAMLCMTTQQQTFSQLVQSNRWHYGTKHGYTYIMDHKSSHPMGPVWHKVDMIEEAFGVPPFHSPYPARKEPLYKTHDWLWWLDFDALIMNSEILITDIIEEALSSVPNPSEIDLIVTPDCFPLNAGSMVIRANRRMIPFWKKVTECGLRSRIMHSDFWEYQSSEEKEGWLLDYPDIEDNEGKEEIYDRVLSEQDCIRLMIENNEMNTRDRSIIIPQWKMNSFPDEIGCFDKDKRPWRDGDFVVHFAGSWAHVKGDDPYGQLMRKYEHRIRW